MRLKKPSRHNDREIHGLCGKQGGHSGRNLRPWPRNDIMVVAATVDNDVLLLPGQKILQEQSSLILMLLLVHFLFCNTIGCQGEEPVVGAIPTHELQMRFRRSYGDVENQ